MVTSKDNQHSHWEVFLYLIVNWKPIRVRAQRCKRCAVKVGIFLPGAKIVVRLMSVTSVKCRPYRNCLNLVTPYIIERASRSI
ncbi:hypothetical protein EB796_013068 [Bugula neritina]|uniref:Uncharacterized protein n=1 Tax=Bugula neritina TaxID=10212 RepID=A0A7J7JQJ2_BUGNE|nr:hypothetical protein EB796_013068 [Bugula neritina]